MSEKPQKPVTIIKQEFTEEIIKQINDTQLPMFVIEYILRDILNDVRITSQRQLESDMKNYQENINQHSNASS